MQSQEKQKQNNQQEKKKVKNELLQSKEPRENGTEIDNERQDEREKSWPGPIACCKIECNDV